MVLSRLDNQLIRPQAVERFVQHWPVDIRVGFGVERCRIKSFDIFVVQGLDLVEPEETFAYFHPDFGAIVQGGGYGDVNILRADGAVRGRLGNCEMWLEIAE